MPIPHCCEPWLSVWIVHSPQRRYIALRTATGHCHRPNLTNITIVGTTQTTTEIV